MTRSYVIDPASDMIVPIAAQPASPQRKVRMDDKTGARLAAFLLNGFGAA